MTFLITPILAAAAVTLVTFFIAWVVTASLKDMTPLDSYWGLSPAAAGWAAALADGWVNLEEAVVCSLASLWGVRLAAYLFARWRHKGGEDSRYASMRKRGGPNYIRNSLINVVGLQAMLSLVVIAPLYAATITTLPPEPILFWLGCAVAFVGFVIEAIADDQLGRFKARKENAGKTLTTGLWGLVRHPNYVGEIAFWLGLALAALAYGAWWALVSPVLVAWLLTSFSGAPLVDRRLAKTRPDFADYAARTPGFLPFAKPKTKDKSAP